VKIFSLKLVTAGLLVGLTAASPAAMAGAGHVHVEPAHGGKIVESAGYHVEWLYQGGILTIYLSDGKGAAVSSKGHTASLLIVAADGRKGPFPLTVGEANKMAAMGVPAFAPPANAILTLTDAKGGGHQFKLK
jgi:hypothetical protein